VALALALIFAALYVYYRRKDRRLLRNGVFLVAAAWFAVAGVVGLLSELVPGFGLLPLAVLALTPLAVLVLAGFLLANGITMLRSEGHSLGNLLSLVAGAAVVVLPLVAITLLSTRDPLAVGAAALLFFLCSYLGVVFVVFLAYSVVYGRMASDITPSAVVVLGSRLIDGGVPPLLRSRLDKALDIYRSVAAVGPPPLLIPSGGKGEDESEAEGAAMAAYLIAHGAAADDVRAETAARNTRQNLELSRGVQTLAGRPGPVLVVTNNYHVLRAAILARRIGSDAQVVGSPTAAYYVPSAFLREFAAVVVEHKGLHAALLLPFVILTYLLVAALYQSGA
jgi:uncharacterized SAM-binding protein YcdF (DUF218 family)